MKYLVTVMPKSEVSDPEGEAILDSARALGFPEISTIRAGRSFLIETDGDLNRIAEISEKLLSNPIVERFEIQTL